MGMTLDARDRAEEASEANVDDEFRWFGGICPAVWLSVTWSWPTTGIHSFSSLTLCARFEKQKNQTKKPKMAAAATPPTTPPAIAPAEVPDDDLPESVLVLAIAAEHVMLGQGLSWEATPSTQTSLEAHFVQSWGGHACDTELVLVTRAAGSERTTPWGSVVQRGRVRRY